MFYRYDKCNIDQLISRIDSDKFNRSSSLDKKELVAAWKCVVSYAYEKVLSRQKAVYLPGFGYLAPCKKSASEFQFLPATHWSTWLDPLHAATPPKPNQMETLNFNAIPSQSGIPQKQLQLAYKDILYQIRQSIVIYEPLELDMGPCGILESKVKPLQFKLRMKPNLNGEAKIVSNELHFPAIADAINRPEKNIPVLDAAPEILISIEKENSGNSQESGGDIMDCVEDGPIPIPKFVIWSMETTHTHNFTGDRRWLNHNCSVCRQIKTEWFDSKEQQKEAEQSEDKHYLDEAIKDSKLFFDSIKESQEKERFKIQLNAMYNLRIAQLKKDEKPILPPLGDIFYSRPTPSDRHLLNLENARLLEAQIQQKNKVAKEREIESLFEERKRNQAFLHQYRKEQEDSHIKKYTQQAEEYTALANQIATHQESINGRYNFGNYFARDETNDINLRRSRAVQIARDQIQALEDKKIQSEEDKKRQLQESTERLDCAKEILKNDTSEMKRIKFETRKFLESCWRRQMKEREMTSLYEDSL